MGSEKLTNYEKLVAKRCGISAASLVCHGATSCGTEWSLLNDWFYVAGTFSGYGKDYIYRSLLRQFIKKAEAIC